MTIKSGKDIAREWLLTYHNDPVKAISDAIDSQIAEILAVIKPIAATPAYYISDADWNKFFTLVAELEAVNGEDNKD